jgi:hypothetical protein
MGPRRTWTLAVEPAAHRRVGREPVMLVRNILGCLTVGMAAFTLLRTLA